MATDPAHPLLSDVLATEHLALYRRAQALAGEPSDAWDLVQDVFERALRRAPPHLQRGQLRRWLRVALHNLFIDRHRQARHIRLVPLTDDVLPAGWPEHDDPPAAWKVVDEAELEQAIAGLDPRLRDVYVLHARDGLSLTAIAEALGIPVATVGTRLFRARRHLRTALEPHVGETNRH